MVLRGEGLHSGQPAAVTLRRAPGPLAIAWPSGAVEREQLTVVRADMGVQVAGPHGERLELVEHLMAALGALGATEGLVVVPHPPAPSPRSWRGGGERWVQGSSPGASGVLPLSTTVERGPGGEVPLLDGGAAVFGSALRALGFVGGPLAGLRVLRPFSFTHGGASYELRPGAGVEVEVAIDFDHPAIGRQRARWDGDADDFLERIAPARTFGFVRDLARLQASGRAHGARADTALVAFGDAGPVNTALRGQDEPARHKLLDLIGDLTLYGGPLQGRVRAGRPGHAATLAMMRAARAAGAVG